MRFIWILLVGITILLSCKGKGDEEPNPYPGYCTEEPGDVWINIRYSDVTSTPDKALIFFSYAGHGSMLNDTPGVYVYHVEEDSFYAFIKTGWYQSLPGMMDISSDGEWMVFSWGKQIWKVKVNGDSLTQLTFSGENFYPRWSPDGKKIVFDSNRDAPHGENVIWMMNSDGSGLRRLNEWGIGECRMPSFDLTGKKIIHVRWGVPGGPAIALMDTTGSNVEIILKASDIGAIDLKSPLYSPDGTKILFVAQRPGEGPMVWVMDTDGSDPVPLANGWMPTWYGKERVLYTNTSNGSIYIMDANGCNKTPFIGDFNFLEGGE